MQDDSEWRAECRRQGKIVITRSRRRLARHSSRKSRRKTAPSAAIIYSDPQGDAYIEGDVYPKGGGGPGGLQRG